MWIKTEIKAEDNLKLLPSCLKQQHCYQNCSFIKKKNKQQNQELASVIINIVLFATLFPPMNYREGNVTMLQIDLITTL